MKPDIFSSAQSLFRRVSDSLRKPDDADPDAAARKRRRIVVAALGAIGVTGGAIYALTHTGVEQSPVLSEVDRAQAVTVTPLSSYEFTPTVTLQGEARPRRDFRVYAPAQGVRILQLLVDEGDYVRAGQPLARLDTAVSTAQIRAAEASVASASAAQRRAADEYARAESIRDSGALSAEAIEQRRAAAGAADAQLAAAQAQLAEVNARLQGGYVRAPAAGLVIQRSAEIGRPVDGQVLFRIAGDNALEVAAEVAEADVLALRIGQRATFQLVNGERVEGVLRRGAAAIDSRTRTGQALFDLPARSPVRAGMYLRGEARLEPREALAAPQDAVLYDNGQPFVYVVGEDNRAHRVMVQVGLRQNEMVEIVAGLEAGAQVIGSGGAFLQDGDPVRPIIPDQAQPPASAVQTGELRGRDG